MCQYSMRPVCSVPHYQAARPAWITTSALRSLPSPLKKGKKNTQQHPYGATPDVGGNGHRLLHPPARHSCGSAAARAPPLLHCTAPQDQVFSLSRLYPAEAARFAISMRVASGGQKSVPNGSTRGHSDCPIRSPWLQPKAGSI
ncbi:hypothetical protein NDU88_001643 [Pleurodeles waltl]|uniref:Uncharacterized protein n=1 Tax=Pleurodeles waltl TaxID=8319 RepID=A0AAV7UXB5_PLEWA|nr:hypothetical protein NDU88_001643 [Pleurodeles waltl]